MGESRGRVRLNNDAGEDQVPLPAPEAPLRGGRPTAPQDPRRAPAEAAGDADDAAGDTAGDAGTRDEAGTDPVEAVGPEAEAEAAAADGERGAEDGEAADGAVAAEADGHEDAEPVAGAAKDRATDDGPEAAAESAADAHDDAGDDAGHASPDEPSGTGQSTATMHLRVRPEAEEPADPAEPPSPTMQLRAPATDRPTRTLRVPQRTSDTPSDVREDAPPATEPPADTPAADEEEAGAEDTSTRLLRVARPAAAEESAAADEDGTAEDTSTRLLRVDPPAAAPSSGEAAEAPDDGDEPAAEDTSTRLLRVDPPAAAPSDGEAAEAPGDGDEPAAEDTSTRLLRVDRPTRALRIGALVGDEDAEGPRRAAPEPGKGGRTGASASGAGRTAPTRAPGGNASAAPAGSATSANETTRPQPTASPTAAPAAAASAPAAAQLTTDVPPDTPETTSEALDVLASLSRRPMTPFRRLLKRVYVWGVFFAFLAAVFTAAQLLRPLPSPQARLSAAPSYTFAGAAPSLAWPTDGQATVEVEGLGSLGHSGADDPVPIASVTKVMTAYLVLRDHPLALGQQGPTLTVDSQAAGDYTSGSAQGESVVRVTAGEQISEYQALQMLLIPSANNVARLLGRWDAGTDAAFVQKMQSEAAALGMTKTTYTDPSGLTNTTRSTANDQLKLARLVMQNPVFRQIVSTPQFTPPGDGVMYNNNTDLGRNGVIGIKTGSSTAALGCLMFAAEQQVGGVQRLVLGVVLGQPATSAGTILQNALSASQQLVTGTEGALQSRVLLHKGDVVGYVDDGLGGRTPLVATADVTVAGWSGLTVQVSLVPKGGSVPHTGSAGQVVATLVVGSGTGRTQTPVALGSRLAEPSFGARLVRLG